MREITFFSCKPQPEHLILNFELEYGSLFLLFFSFIEGGEFGLNCLPNCNREN